LKFKFGRELGPGSRARSLSHLEGLQEGSAKHLQQRRGDTGAIVVVTGVGGSVRLHVPTCATRTLSVDVLVFRLRQNTGKSLEHPLVGTFLLSNDESSRHLPDGLLFGGSRQIPI
jgi:hypothetical protein